MITYGCSILNLTRTISIGLKRYVENQMIYLMQSEIVETNTVDDQTSFLFFLLLLDEFRRFLLLFFIISWDNVTTILSHSSARFIALTMAPFFAPLRVSEKSRIW